jgi:hypothetical protein
MMLTLFTGALRVHAASLLWLGAGTAFAVIGVKAKTFYPAHFGQGSRKRRPVPAWQGRVAFLAFAAICFWNGIQSLRT